MKPANQLGVSGAFFLAACLVGYAVYALILYPKAGLPTTHFAVIVAAADTLRIGHWLKLALCFGMKSRS